MTAGVHSQVWPAPVGPWLYLSKMPAEEETTEAVGRTWVKGLLQTLWSYLEFTLLQESSHSSDDTSELLFSRGSPEPT